MKDLYRRCGLKAYESDHSKLTNVSQGSEQDQTACFSILLNSERKSTYDNTHRALVGIAKARCAIDLPSNTQWVKRYSDFAEAADEPQPIEKMTDRQPSSENTHESNNRSHPAHNPKSNTRKLGAIATAAVLVVTLVTVLFSGNDNSSVPAIEMERLLTPELMHVKTINAAVYSKVLTADEFIEPITELDNQTEITVDQVSLDGEWVWVELPSVQGYTLRSNLRSGPSEHTIVERCREAGVQRPITGVQNNYFIAGAHVLTLANPPGKDAIVKLKNGNGDVQLVAYLRSGEELIVNGLSSGRHHLEYALGENYSEQCGRFLDHMQSFREEKPLFYQGNELDESSLANRYVYILKSKVVGLKSIPNDVF